MFHYLRQRVSCLMLINKTICPTGDYIILSIPCKDSSVPIFCPPCTDITIGNTMHIVLLSKRIQQANFMLLILK